MKLIFTLIAVTLLLSIQNSDNSKQSITGSKEKLNLFCPDPPAFSEMIRIVSDKDKSGTDEIDQDWYSKAMVP